MRSLASKLVLVLLMCTMGVTALLMVFEYHAGQNLIDRQVNKTLHAIGQRLSLSLRQSLYELDRVTTHDTVLSEFTAPELQAILVWDDDRRQVVVGFGRLPDGSLEEVSNTPTLKGLQQEGWPVVVASSRVDGGYLTVGEIDVFVNRGPLEKALIDQLEINLLKVLLTVALILVILSKVLNQYLVSPLERIQKAMLETKAFFSHDKHSDDEIARLTEILSENWSEHAFTEMQQMDGALRGMVVAALDRQDKLQLSDDKHRKLSQEFEAVLDGLADALMLFDLKKEIVWANRSALYAFGATIELQSGSPARTIWGETQGKVCEDSIDDIYRTGQSMENLFIDKQKRPWGVKAYPVYNSDGDVVNVIQIASDLSEKFRLREEAARSAHLAALGELSAGIAHEINNPTGLILMATPFVKDSLQDLLPLLDDYVEEHPGLMVGGLPYTTFRKEILLTIDDIQGGAVRVKRIVNDLKDFASEKPASDDLEVDLREMIEKSLRLLHNVIKNSTNHFFLEIEDDLPKVKGSMQRLEQVMVNLVQNACQALTDKEQAVTLKVYPDNDRKLVVLQLTDQGKGIPIEVMDKITDPFFTTRREVGGTGLGLSVSSRIIDEHGGVLKIESQPGQGATFTIKLPVNRGEIV